MAKDDIKIERNDLYEKVWTTPVWNLCREYGLSDVGLAKICRKMEVPRPPRGYWRQVERGKAVKRPPLPRLSAYAVTEIRVDRSKKACQRPRAKAKIVVPEELNEPHPFTERARKSFGRAKINHRRVLRPEADRHLDMRVGKACIDRALRIFDALLKAAEAEGLIAKLDPGGRTSFEVDGEPVFVTLEEYLTQKEEVTRWGYRHLALVPTGRLSLKIQDVDRLGVQQRWNDAKYQRVEHVLADFIEGIKEAAVALRKRRIEREEREKRWREEEQKRLEQRFRELEEERRLEVLEEQIGRWERAQRIRDFVAVVEAKASGSAKNKLEPWIASARKSADRLDPLMRGIVID